jgi:hypothetical protein
MLYPLHGAYDLLPPGIAARISTNSMMMRW